MKTHITTSPTIAAEYILDNKLVAFPTETVYGLGANAYQRDAVKKIFTAKGRPSDNPLIVHIADIGQLPSVVSKIPSHAEKLMEKFFPGPLTLVLPKNKNISPLVTAGLQTVGVRIPQHTLALKFLYACGIPVAAPSANLSGKPSPTHWQSVKHDLNNKIACILKAQSSEVGVESTVVDCTVRTPIILRAGGVALEELREILPTIRIGKHYSNGAVLSPGIKYRHYSPKATVHIISNTEEIVPDDNAAYIGMQRLNRKNIRLMKMCHNKKEYARSLFYFFRRCDKKNIRTIYCESVSEDGIGLALMDRIRKASQQ